MSSISNPQIRLDTEQFLVTLLFWSKRFHEHGLVLYFYLNDLKAAELEGSPLSAFRNALQTRSLRHLAEWEKLNKEIEAGVQFKCDSSIQFGIPQIMESKNNVEFLRKFSPKFLEAVTSFKSFKEDVIKFRNARKHPGGMSQALASHMLSELQYVESLITGQLTPAQELKIALDEAMEHTQLLSQFIEPIDENHMKRISGLLNWVQEFARKAKEINVNSPFEEVLFLFQTNQTYLKSILSPEVRKMFPPEFGEHETKETNFYCYRLWAWMKRNVVGK